MSKSIHLMDTTAIPASVPGRSLDKEALDNLILACERLRNGYYAYGYRDGLRGDEVRDIISALNYVKDPHRLAVDRIRRIQMEVEHLQQKDPTRTPIVVAVSNEIFAADLRGSGVQNVVVDPDCPPRSVYMTYVGDASPAWVGDAA